MAKWKFLLKSILGIIALICVQRFCHHQTDGFSLSKITSNLTPNPAWEVAPPSPAQMEEVRQALGQPFAYLAKGAQCYAFVSKDGKYVIKFFRHSRLNPSFWTTLIPLPSLQKKAARLHSKLHKDFNSYRIAYEELRDETALLYLHLNKTVAPLANITIADKLCISHVLPLADTEFLLQRRAELLYPTLETMMARGENQAAEQALDSLVDLLFKRFQRGIFDKDPDLHSNFGFIEANAVQIDIGRFHRDPSQAHRAAYYPAIIRITDHLHQWLEERYPDLDAHLKQKIAALP